MSDNNDVLNNDDILKAGEESTIDSSKLKFDESQVNEDELKVETRPVIELMTDELKALEPKALLFNAHFKSLITKAIQKLPVASTNGIIITGRPGIGKTYNITKALNEAKANGYIENYTRATGHITPTKMLEALKYSTVESGKVIKPLFLDDCDFYLNTGNLELLKSALETRDSSDPNNRVVKYNSAFAKSAFKFNGLVIIASNQNFTKNANLSRDKEANMHLEALKSRCHIFKLIVTNDVMKVNCIRMVENFLNSPEGSYLTPESLDKIKAFVNEELLEWLDKDLFNISGLGFDMRIVKKIIDCIFMYDDEWKIFSTDYRTLKDLSNRY